MSGETSSIILVSPAIEHLLSRDPTSLWPARVLENATVVKSTTVRTKLVSALHGVFKTIPDPTMDVEVAFKTGLVRAEELACVYENLAVLLAEETYNRRLVLYLPFELLPPIMWQRDSDGLQSASTRFVRTYMMCWRALLADIDVRANFVDGDILEKELAPDGQPLVVKAAHLIPQLCKKGYITPEEMMRLRDATDNDVLRSSISESLEAMSLPKPATLEMPTYDLKWLAGLPEEIRYELDKLDMREALDNSRGMPPLRVAWERKNRADKLATLYGSRIADALVSGALSTTEVGPFLAKGKPGTLRIATLRGLRDAMVRSAADQKKAWGLFSCLYTRVQTVGQPIEPLLHDEFQTVLAYALEMNVLDRVYEKVFEYKKHPSLDGPFELSGALAADLMDFEPVVHAIELDEKYSKLMYPVAIFFGSRLKGYATAEADLDAAVFIRPGTKKKDRKVIREVLKELFSIKRVDGKVVEFWLEEKDGALRIRDHKDPDLFLADNSWSHLLLSSVWLGAESAVRELYEKLLPSLLDTGLRVFEGQELRGRVLEEMEREVLQYRLMHKGYRRFFPKRGGIDERAADLGPQSVFWDPGYRRLATKLFVSRVFLPQLRK